MTAIKRFLIFYLINLLLLTFITLLFGERLSNWVAQLAFWLVPLFFVSVGQILGFITFVFIDSQTTRGKSLMIVSIISSIAFIGITFFMKYSNWRHKRDYGNIESNQTSIKYFYDGYQKEASIAFLKLESQFKNPNIFRIVGSSTIHRDTLVNGYTETAYTFRFIYLIGTDSTKFFSEILVLENIPYLLDYNMRLSKAELRKFDSFKTKAIENIKEGLNKLPDSIQKDITDKIGNDWEK